MKRIIKSLSIVLIVFGMFFTTTGCDNSPEAQQKAFEDEMNEKAKTLYYALKACTGTCLTREEMAQLVYNYEKVQERYSGKTADFHKHITYPELQLITPGEHEHDDKTRYEITLLDTDENGFHKGLEVKVMSDTSGCKIEEPDPQQPEETAQDAVGLSVNEIVGKYSSTGKVSVNMKGKDEDEEWTEIDSQEITFNYTVEAVEGNTIRLSMEGIKVAEGAYDPATGICETKYADEFYTAFNMEPKGESIRITFSKQDGQVQFETIDLSKENAVPAYAYKVE